MHPKRQVISPIGLILLGLILVLAGLGGSWGSAYGQTAGPTPTRPVQQSALRLEKRADQSVAQPGATVIFTIVVVNEGSAIAETVVITDQVPAAFNVMSVNTTKGTATVVGQLVTVNVGTLDVGEMVTVTITTQVRNDAQPGEISNIASVVSTSQAGVIVSNAAPVMIQPAATATPTVATPTVVMPTGVPSPTPLPTPGGLPDTGGPRGPIPDPAELPDTSVPASNPLWPLVAVGVLLIIAGMALLRRRRRA